MHTFAVKLIMNGCTKCIHGNKCIHENKLNVPLQLVFSCISRLDNCQSILTGNQSCIDPAQDKPYVHDQVLMHSQTCCGGSVRTHQQAMMLIKIPFHASLQGAF